MFDTTKTKSLSFPTAAAADDVADTIKCKSIKTSSKFTYIFFPGMYKVSLFSWQKKAVVKLTFSWEISLSSDNSSNSEAKKKVIYQQENKKGRRKNCRELWLMVFSNCSPWKKKECNIQNELLVSQLMIIVNQKMIYALLNLHAHYRPSKFQEPIKRSNTKIRPTRWAVFSP